MAHILETLRDLDVSTLGKMLDDLEEEHNLAAAEGLTMAEGMADICHRRFHISSCYFGAVRRPLLARVRAFEQEERPISLSRWYASAKAHDEAKRLLDEMTAGSNFYGTRAHCDAEATEEYTEAIAEICWQRYSEQKRAHNVIEKGRKARTVRRTHVSPTGYVKTGKYVWKDGVQIPVMRKQ
jgi:hypothetical protein